MRHAFQLGLDDYENKISPGILTILNDPDFQLDFFLIKTIVIINVSLTINVAYRLCFLLQL